MSEKGMNHARSISRPVRVVPLECAGRVQHRNRLQPSLGARDFAHRLHCEDAQGVRASYTYAALQTDANRLSNALAALGVQRGDRVAIVLPQRLETAIAHIAIYQLGAVAMPLSLLFGAGGAANTGCTTAVPSPRSSMPPPCPRSRRYGHIARSCAHLIAVGERSGDAREWSEALSAAADRFECVNTRPTTRPC